MLQVGHYIIIDDHIAIGELRKRQRNVVWMITRRQCFCGKREALVSVDPAEVK